MLRISFFLCLLLTSCAQPLPDANIWNGSVELAPGKRVPFQLHLEPGGKSGAFVVGGERTPVPEIFRSGQTLTLNFSEYGAEMQGAWDGHAWNGVYLRHRDSGTKAFRFS